MHIEILDKHDCSGCTACASICSKDAIIMQSDDLGFKYPQVDESACVGCGKCIDICQFKENYSNYSNYSYPNVFAGREKDERQLLHSQSGGAFHLFSSYILSQNGVVYGVALDQHFKACHISVNNEVELEKLRGSKYVQSDLGNSFKDIKQHLKNDKIVLFSGTPCQVSGLRSFIGPKLSERLYTIDILCHGVPSPKIWTDYLEFLAQKYKGKISKVNFRDKSYGWDNALETYEINGQKKESHLFLDLYFGHYISRDCCSCCPFTNFKRIGDITIGDFWGWHRWHTTFLDNKGLSVILINSDKGQLLFNAIASQTNYEISNMEECIQNALRSPRPHNLRRSSFIKEYNEKGISYVLNKYTVEGWKLRWKIKIAKLLNYYK